VPRLLSPARCVREDQGGALMMSREWERGRLARIADKTRADNPHAASRIGSRQRLRWLAGWLFQDGRMEAPAREATREPVRGEVHMTECCGAREQAGAHDGGAVQAWCDGCHEITCSACAFEFSQEDGYGDDGRGVRTHALCRDCAGEREEKRQRREARNDSGV